MLITGYSMASITGHSLSSIQGYRRSYSVSESRVYHSFENYDWFSGWTKYFQRLSCSNHTYRFSITIREKRRERE